jgi:valyl-tRNA synthetase
MTELPKKYNHIDAEKKWRDYWEKEGTYTWDPTQGRDTTFSVDTPPPTVSGSLHIGHVFSYTQTDVVVRFNRMKGKNIFYPMGWDDNGLPTERRVQNVYGINCKPSVAYNKDWKPEEAKKNLKRSDFQDVSRQNFIEACEILTKADEKTFEDMWRHLGLSVDWSQQYATIDGHCRKTSQFSFLDLVDKGQVFQNEAPTMWDIDFQTAVAQAELEDRECPGAYHDIRFQVEGGGDFVISTTRPELLPACVAVVAHPDDERFKPYFGKTAITPLFGAKVPILSAEHADPEKGTGILMICTFGDVNDVDWWKTRSDIPVKQVIGRNGCLVDVEWGEAPFESENVQEAQKNYNEIQGLRIKKAQKRIVELLEEAGVLTKEPEAITHPVKFYEKGDSPIEFIPTRQWFITILKHKEALLAQGQKINWQPPYMKSRYDNWVEGLNQDWCISRQRYFGVPFPVWYPVKADGELDYDAPIYAKKEALPVDPMSDTAPGFSEEQRNQAGGFSGCPDVMDTWATSSLTPQLTSHWGLDEDKHSRIFPYDLRPQSHEIIRTWAFYTITKAWMHNNDIPWKNVAISGWVLDPDRKKMSKSKGNVVTPAHLLEEFSSDAVRYWSAKARLGSDTALDEGVFGIGKKLATKLFNASKFVVMQIQDAENLSVADITEPLDCAQVSELQAVIASATKAFESMDYATALEKAETSFWKFCDHYIELVKVRAYREENETKKRSAQAALEISLKTYIRLLAPFLPYITEEIWSWIFSSESSSIHRASWPTIAETETVKDVSVDTLDLAISVLSDIRTAKTKAQKGMKHPVDKLSVCLPEHDLSLFKTVLDDIVRAGSVETVELCTGEKSVDVNLSV